MAAYGYLDQRLFSPGIVVFRIEILSSSSHRTPELHCESSGESSGWHESCSAFFEDSPYCGISSSINSLLAAVAVAESVSANGSNVPEVS